MDRKELAELIAERLRTSGAVDVDVTTVADEFPDDDTAHAGFVATMGGRSFIVQVYDDEEQVPLGQGAAAATA
jgi:hypothetical protein